MEKSFGKIARVASSLLLTAGLVLPEAGLGSVRSQDKSPPRSEITLVESGLKQRISDKLRSLLLGLSGSALDEETGEAALELRAEVAEAAQEAQREAQIVPDLTAEQVATMQEIVGHWPEGQARTEILLVGDSNTVAGYFTFDGLLSNWSKLARIGVRSDFFLGDQTVGATSYNLEVYLQAHHPGMVFIMLGTNDMAQGIPIDDYEHNLEQLVETALANDTLVVLQTFSILGTDGMADRVVAANQAIYRVADQYHVPVLDVEQIFETENMMVDNHHLGPTAQRQRQAAIVETVRQIASALDLNVAGYLSGPELASSE